MHLFLLFRSKIYVFVLFKMWLKFVLNVTAPYRLYTALIRSGFDGPCRLYSKLTYSSYIILHKIYIKLTYVCLLVFETPKCRRKTPGMSQPCLRSSKPVFISPPTTLIVTKPKALSIIGAPQMDDSKKCPIK